MKTLVNDGLRFVCHTEQELWRARTLLTKEPGTILWLNEYCHTGDVFYDIGANVGCYTLYAARLVGPSGHVYAFEPHPANAAALIANILANQYQDRVTVITMPLDAVEGHRYLELGGVSAGTSGTTAQYEHRTMILTQSTTVDRLIACAQMRLPTVIKMDVDGNEPLIIRGMRACLLSWCPPVSLQIESAPSNRDVIEGELQACGYLKQGQHYTSQCQADLNNGATPAQVIENAIFARVTA